jgi:fatty-acyl-CoA synthase
VTGVAVPDVAVPVTVADLWQRARAAFADHTALVTEDERISYDELGRRIDRCAAALVASGVAKGSHVGLLLPNEPDWVALALAAAGIGAVVVPVSTFSSADDLAYQLRHADVTHLVVATAFAGNDNLAALRGIVPGIDAEGPAVGLLDAGAPHLRGVVVRGTDDVPAGAVGWDAFLAAGEAVPAAVVAGLRAAVDADDDCYLLYTSGSTAEPKGVLHRHHAVASNGFHIGEAQHAAPGEAAYFYYPFFFSAGCINVLLGGLSHGACLIVTPIVDPVVTLALIEQEGAVALHVWPHTLDKLREHPDWATRAHDTLHKGTGPVDVWLGTEAQGGVGGVSMYGLTETCTAITCTPADADVESRTRTCGRPLPGNEVRIVDPGTGEAVAPGEEGEIVVRGRSLLRRYYKVPAEQTFDADGFFHTGDKGRLDDEGRLRYHGRYKELIKVGGVNVSPAEVAAKLAQVPGVRAAHVFGVPAGSRGEEVAAVLVADDGAVPTTAQVDEHARSTLPSFKRPAVVVWMAEDQIPYTGSGKVLTRELRERVLATGSTTSPGGSDGA